MSDPRRFSFVRPTINTPFHIDFTWWQTHDNNWRVFLHSMLCKEHQAVFADLNSNVEIDWIDPETAVVKQVDGLQQVLVMHCAKGEDFLTDHTTLVDGVFRAFLANDNSPLTPTQLAEMIHKPAETILRTLAGATVYKGIRPYQTPNKPS